jgi:ketosteroid isomerase-like protein
MFNKMTLADVFAEGEQSSSLEREVSRIMPKCFSSSRRNHIGEVAMSKGLALTLLILGGIAYAQSLAPTTQESRQLANINQRYEQPSSPQQKEVWAGEQNYFRYLQAKDLKSFMSLWDDNFVGWPDYSERPLRKSDIESGARGEFQASPTSSRQNLSPKPEAIAVFGDVAVTYYLWPEADETSPLKYRITHTWRKGPEGWRIISGMDCEVPRSREAKTGATRSGPSVATTAQESAAKNAVTKSASQMERLIHALAGEWATEEIYEPSDLLPKGGTGRSRDSYRVGPARSSLIEEYHSEGAGGKSWGIGTIWWDAEAQGFHFVWCDSFALDKGCRVSSQLGKWIGNDYVATDAHEVSGKQLFEKEVWSDFTPNSFSQTLYTGDASDKLKRFLTIKAKRVIKRHL